jgi:hypothetical protein
MLYSLNGKKYNIPDDYLTKNMQLLKISKMEAVQLWLEDENVLQNDELDALDAKAKNVKIDHGTSKGVGLTQKNSRPRKENPEKRDLIKFFYENINNCAEKGIKNAKITKSEREISFSIGENDYSLTLTCHRAKK